MTRPAVEPLTLAEVKDHLREDPDVTAGDADIARKIEMARVAAENYTGRQLINATYESRFDGFAYELPLLPAPLVSVSSVEYIANDADGTLTAVASSVYTVDTFGTIGRVICAYGQTWPQPRAEPHAVRVTHVSGYGAHGSDVPAPIRQAMLLMISEAHENREQVAVGVSATAIPLALTVQNLLLPYCVAMPAGVI